ncbi:MULTISPECIES: glycosyltransferase family 4 protein [unclassified Flavobacterium]|uniref:glycosyltransferase family 4 protein n=1 Tax=unclassified Flavobacterium TaxID=196869 RepID=UPI001F135A2B|nr:MULTISPECIES: glycosyltransferase family 4 protein [unclassified Flavobacterium]UMY65833.1 glycosyltransferase family 4 protein [Flavobacterium sp. HJ-32-4]
MKKRKLIVGISFEGSVILLPGQMRHFTDLGYETYLLAPVSDRCREFCEREGCTLLPIVIEREISLFRDIKTLIAIIRIFRRVKPDIINLGTPKVSLLGMMAGYLLGIRNRIYTCRGYRFEHEHGMKRRILVGMEKLTSKLAHEIICISPSVREFGLKNRLFSPEKAHVINKGSSNGFDLRRFHPDAVDPEAKKKLAETLGFTGKFVYGFVGRIVDRKGIRELFEAFSALSAKYPDLELLIVGGVEEVQIADKTMLKRMQDTPNIHFVGPQKDVPLYISLCDVFVLPAWWEGFGNVLVQAAAVGVPVISTTGTGSRDAVSHDFNGLLVEPKDEVGLAAAMERLYADRDLRLQMGRNGLEWARNFDNAIIWNGMDELYKKR